jgi:hypothetical protein
MAANTTRWQAAGAVFMGMVGLVGLVAQLTTVTPEVNKYVGVALAVTILVLALWLLVAPLRWWFSAAGTIPAIKRIRELCTLYEVVQATKDDLKWTAGLEQRVYSSADAIPLEQFEEWYAINPNGFYLVRKRDGKEVGHLNMLPIKPATMAKFVAGEIGESGIRGDSLYGPAERHAIKELYIESIAIDPSSRPRDAALLCMLSQTIKLIAGVAPPQQLESIYAIAASRPGACILRDLGFKVVKPAGERADNHPMYKIAMTALIENLKGVCADRLDLQPLAQKVV